MKNPQLESLIKELKKTSIDNDVNIWKRVATDLEKPLSKARIVNLTKLEKTCDNDDVVIVPGKVLGMGDLTKRITVAAYTFSGQAMEKITASGSKAMSINDLVRMNPKGSKIKIIG